MGRFKQVIAVRNDLTVGRGKLVAQGAHASIMFLVRRLCDPEGGEKDHAIQEWLANGMTKICVRVDSEAELLEIAQKAQDAGLTVHVITKTCLAIGPDEEDRIAVTGKLKLL